VGLRREPTGAPVAWNGDVVATAKRGLAAGEMLDGEGGYTVYGKLMPAAESLARGGLPLGLAHGVKLKRAIGANAPVRWDDVEYDANGDAVGFRREMERVNRLLMGGASDARARVLAATLASAIAGVVIHPLSVDLDDESLRSQLGKQMRKLL